MTRRIRLLRRRRLLCMAALHLVCHLLVRAPPTQQVCTLGRGYGSPGFTRASFERVRTKPVWREFRAGRVDDEAFQRQCLMTVDEFSALLQSLYYLRAPLEKQATALRFEDKILLLFRWLVHYQDYKVLGQQFGTTTPVIASLVATALPLLVGHFTRAIPNCIRNEQDVAPLKTSALSDQIVAVIGVTQHLRKADNANEVFPHGMATHMLVDYDGYIASFVTSVSQCVPIHEAADRSTRSVRY